MSDAAQGGAPGAAQSPIPPERDPHAPERNAPPSFDGIRELDANPPRLWTYMYLLCFGAAVWLFVAYPAIPWLTSDARTGVFQWSSRAELGRAVQHAEETAPDVAVRFARASLEQAEADPAMRAYAIAGGHAAWGNNCAPCHGQDGRGTANYPNLRDRDWLWGGTPEAIRHTLQVGIRWPGEESTRSSQMPAFGRLRSLERPQVLDLVEFVRSLSGQEHNAAGAARAEPVFAENCASCHGARGEGNQEVGGPRLNDDAWLYGGTREAIYDTIWNSRSGVMPAFGQRLPEDTIRKLVLYVRSFGGGE
ncbi:cytochrome-c oxidase, cbb3-type subunit III [Muricoccus radiodurans]|uniref:cytochrome-c oxidase, cbb3-type subunit III n=1 Tax=Muricoccus radiodurans TaxID=2231721 RepID=UPI003CF3A3F4